MTEPREELVSVVRLALSDASNKAVGDSVVPSDNPSTPYFVIHDLGTGEGFGGYDDPEDFVDVTLQFMCVGRSPKQVRWASHELFKVMRDPDAHPLTLTSATLAWRRSELRGAIMPSGKDLYQSADLYRFRLET